MYQRIKASLVNPKKIADYENDPLLISIIYLLVFSLLFAIPYMLVIKDFGGHLKGTITKEIQKNEVIEYVISDNKLISTLDEPKTYLLSFEDSSMNYFQIVIGNDLGVIDEQLLSTSIVIQYAEDGIYFCQTSLLETKTKLLSYNNEVDLRLMKTGDLKSISGFTKYVDDFIDSHKLIIYSIAIPGVFLYSVIEILFTTLMSAVLLLVFFGKYGIKFGKIYKLTLYCALPTVLGVLLSILFSSWPIFGLLNHVGFFATTCFAIIVINELSKRNFNKNEEGNNNESI